MHLLWHFHNSVLQMLSSKWKYLPSPVLSIVVVALIVGVALVVGVARVVGFVVASVVGAIVGITAAR